MRLVFKIITNRFALTTNDTDGVVNQAEKILGRTATQRIKADNRRIEDIR
jgi:hypothetical protein